jgi:hypothetical protein
VSINLNLIVHLTPTQMRKLNPYLKKKKLTIQQAVERGIEKRIPTLYLNTGIFLAAIEGIGLSLEKS